MSVSRERTGIGLREPCRLRGGTVSRAGSSESAGVKAVVLLNPAAGTLASESPVDRVVEAFARTTVQAEVRLVEAPGLPEAVRAAAASDVDLVVLGGGDGTLSVAAQVLAGGGKPLGILPLGTLNHFAQDLRI